MDVPSSSPLPFAPRPTYIKRLNLRPFFFPAESIALARMHFPSSSQPGHCCLRAQVFCSCSTHLICSLFFSLLFFDKLANDKRKIYCNHPESSVSEWDGGCARWSERNRQYLFARVCARVRWNHKLSFEFWIEFEAASPFGNYIWKLFIRTHEAYTAYGIRHTAYLCRQTDWNECERKTIATKERIFSAIHSAYAAAVVAVFDVTLSLLLL